MSTRVVASAQKFIHDNYTAVVAPGATKTAGAGFTINFLYVDNMDTSIDVYISFDAGVSYKTIKAGTYFSIECDGLPSYKIWSASGTPAVEAVYGVEN